jgi:hypothetical protein
LPALRLLNACELEEIAGWITTKESGPVRNRRVVVGFVARGLETPAGVFQIFDVQAKVAPRDWIRHALEEVQLEAIPRGEPDQVEMLQRGGRWDLAQAEKLSIESSENILFALGERR